MKRSDQFEIFLLIDSPNSAYFYYTFYSGRGAASEVTLSPGIMERLQGSKKISRSWERSNVCEYYLEDAEAWLRDGWEFTVIDQRLYDRFQSEMALKCL